MSIRSDAIGPRYTRRGPMNEKRPRKLLIASIGVATLTYVACSDRYDTSGNLVPPDTGTEDVSFDGGTDSNTAADTAVRDSDDVPKD